MINRGNYDKIIEEFGIDNLDPILKAGHENYLEIKEFYQEDDDVRNTIDLYFRKLERYIHKHKERESEKVIKRPKGSPEVKEAMEAAKTYKHLDIEKLKMIQMLEQSHEAEHGKTEENQIRQKALEKELAKREKRNKSRQPKEKKQKPKVEPKAKSNSKPKLSNAKKVEHLTEDRKFIRRFVGLHNKIKTKGAILNFIKALQKAIAQKLISKKSQFVKEIRQVQDALIRYYNTMSSENVIQIPEKVLPRYVAIAGGEEVYKSIGIIKSFIGLQGKQLEEKRMVSLIKQIENAIEKGKVGKDDPYLPKVKDILKNLKKYEPNKEIQISKVELNGLEGILNACGCSNLGKIYDTKGKTLRKCKKQTYSDARKGACSHNKGLAGLPIGVMTAEQIANLKFELLPFSGIWAELIGKPEKNFSLMLHGEPGAGKSTFLIKFAKYLTSFGKVLYLSSEEFGSVTLTNLVNQYLNPLPSNLVFARDLSLVKISDFDFVIFDSMNDLGLKLEDYKEIKAENPKTAFIFVLQHTKDGQFKGGKEWEHEAQIAATIENGTINVYKNRYGVKNSWYFFDN